MSLACPWVPSISAKETSVAHEPSLFPWLEFLCLGATATLLFQPLVAVWNLQPDYAFARGVPLLALYLWSQAWRTRLVGNPVPFRMGIIAILLIWSALLLLTRLLEETVPDWRPVLWLGAALNVCGILCWCWLRGGFAWMRHFAFSAGFLFLAVPWPYQFETWMVQGLMRGNALLVANSLALADVPALAMGNTIALTCGTLGVEQACSGIHSLQATCMMSFFLGEFYHLGWSRRGLLTLLGFLIALLGNYLRLLFLAATAATSGFVSMSALHDLAAEEILIPTLMGIWVAALCLRPKESVAAVASFRPAVREAKRPGNAALFWAVALLCVAMINEIMVREWFAWHERSAPQIRFWHIALPFHETGFRPLPIPAATHQLLGDSYAEAGTWAGANGWAWQLYYFRYAAQRSNRVSLDLHNPEVCLPAAGQRELARFPEFLWSQRGVNLVVDSFLFTAPKGPRYVFWIIDGQGFRSGHLTNIIYGDGVRALSQRFFFWMKEAGQGIRLSSSQSLEVTILGPSDFVAARRAMEEFIAQSLR